MNRSADQRLDQNAAEIRLKGKIETGDYDVFLCHNSRGKPQVIAIAERLRERGILPWLDIWDIPQGTRWQQELRKQLKPIKSARRLHRRQGARAVAGSRSPDIAYPDR